MSICHFFVCHVAFVGVAINLCVLSSFWGPHFIYCPVHSLPMINKRNADGFNTRPGTRHPARQMRDLETRRPMLLLRITCNYFSSSLRVCIVALLWLQRALLCQCLVQFIILLSSLAINIGMPCIGNEHATAFCFRYLLKQCRNLRLCTNCCRVHPVGRLPAKNQRIVGCLKNIYCQSIASAIRL